MDALGTNRSVLVDKQFAKDLDTLVEDAQKRGNERELKHARGIRYFAYG
jgi:hypothetical protein